MAEMTGQQIEALVEARAGRLADYYTSQAAGLPTHPQNIKHCLDASDADAASQLYSHDWQSRTDRKDYKMVCKECGKISVLKGKAKKEPASDMRSGFATGRASYEDSDDDRDRYSGVPQSKSERDAVLAKARAYRAEQTMKQRQGSEDDD